MSVTLSISYLTWCKKSDSVCVFGAFSEVSGPLCNWVNKLVSWGILVLVWKSKQGETTCENAVSLYQASCMCRRYIHATFSPLFLQLFYFNLSSGGEQRAENSRQIHTSTYSWVVALGESLSTATGAGGEKNQQKQTKSGATFQLDMCHRRRLALQCNLTLTRDAVSQLCEPPPAPQLLLSCRTSTVPGRSKQQTTWIVRSVMFQLAAAWRQSASPCAERRGLLLKKGSWIKYRSGNESNEHWETFRVALCESFDGRGLCWDQTHSRYVSVKEKGTKWVLCGYWPTHPW